MEITVNLDGIQSACGLKTAAKFSCTNVMKNRCAVFVGKYLKMDCFKLRHKLLLNYQIE